MKIKRRGIWIVLTGEILLLTILTWSILSQVVRARSFIAIMTVGQSAVILTGGIDLSVGSVLGLSGVVTAVLLNLNFSIVAASSIGILVGLLSGLSNGLLITKAKLPPFIATLGMMSVARGLAFAITGGETIRSLPPAFLQIGQGEMLHVPIPIVVMAIFAIMIGYLLKIIPYGLFQKLCFNV